VTSLFATGNARSLNAQNRSVNWFARTLAAYPKLKIVVSVCPAPMPSSLPSSSNRPKITPVVASAQKKTEKTIGHLNIFY